MSEEVTVIISAYNHPEWLSESLNSVLGQTDSNVEIIVVGSISNDGGFKDVLSQYKDKVICCEIKNTGCGLMMNEALKIATGEFVLRLDEGDVLLHEMLEVQTRMFKENPAVGLTITAYQVMGEDGSIQNAVYIPDFPQNPLLLLLLYGHVLAKSRVMIRRECYQRVGLYKDSLATENDMWIRLARHYKVGIVNTPLVNQRSCPVDNQLEERVRRDTQWIISEAAASIPLEEIFPHLQYLQSQSENSLIKSSAYAAIGAILMEHELYANARDNFVKAHQLCPDASIHQMWLGVLSRRAKDYQAALSYFAKVTQNEGDRFFLDAKWAIVLTYQAQKASTGTEAQGKLRAELAREYNILLHITLDFASGKLHGSVPLLSEIAEEAQLYLCWDMPQVLESLFKGTKMIRDEWNRISPQTSDAVIDFYKETENYIFDLAWWHREPERKRLTTAAIDICERKNARKILDFGCGIGQDGILFAEAGFEVTLSDLPGRTFDYAKWRAERRGLEINFINSDELSEKYDAILCFDVLEHLWEPGEIVEYLYNHLSDDGILLVTAHFEHTETHPMHLKRNIKYLGPAFLEMMSQAGFRMEPWSRIPLVFQARRDLRQGEEAGG